jgi:DNA gyrase inhibitor GyrI
MEETIAIENLGSMRVAAIRAFSKSPEMDAWEKVKAWAEAAGILEELSTWRRVLGFDSPPPMEGSEEYGYEYWIELGVDEAVQGEGVEIKEFQGGRYAVHRCEVLGSPWETIPASWNALNQWVKANGYAYDDRLPFELYQNPGAPLSDLVLYQYYPIA